MRKTIKILNLLAILILSVSCQLPAPALSDPDDPVSSDMPTVVPTEEMSEWIESEAAIVESIDVLIMESWPLQANAVVKGFLPDGCTRIYRSTSQRYSQLFRINLVTRHPKDAFCTEALEPFEVVVPLEVSGLQAGTYQVDAYGVQAQFTFKQDNILPEPSS